MVDLIKVTFNNRMIGGVETESFIRGSVEQKGYYLEGDQAEGGFIRGGRYNAEGCGSLTLNYKVN